MKYVSFPWLPVVAAHDLRGLHEHCIAARVIGFGLHRRRFPIKIAFLFLRSVRHKD